jgi:hypothetical protein
MPTGYTAPIADGEVNSLSEFLHTVASAFIIDMREAKIGSPIPDMRPMNPRYQQAVDEARAKVAALATLSYEEIVAGARNYNEGLIRAQRESVEWRERNNEPFLAMQAKVMAWDAPEALSNVKDFMIQQLETSCYGVLKRDTESLPFMNPQEWIDDERKDAQRRLDLAADDLAEATARRRKSEAWMKTLKDEIERLKAEETVSA